MLTEIVWFEGPDMWGKSTQVKRVAERLRKEGYKVLTLRNPGGEPDELCGKIRSLLLDTDSAEHIDYLSRRLLNTADHMQKLNIISNSIGQYDYILCDRCNYISDMVYGFMMEDNKYARHLKREAFKAMFSLEEINMYLLHAAAKYTSRHHLILGTISKNEMMRRFEESDRPDKPTIYDNENNDFKLRVRDNYEQIFHTQLGMVENPDSPAILSVLDSFDFISNYSGDDSIDELTSKISELLLIGKKSQEEIL